MSERTSSADRHVHPTRRVRHTFGRFLREADGATAIEYAMIGGLIFAVIAGSLKLYGSKMSGVYGQIGSAIAQVN